MKISKQERSTTSMNKAMKVLLTAALAVTTSGAAMASHVCAYVNDNLRNFSHGPNKAEGYRIGPGTAVVHVGPYATNGRGIGNGFADGLATRVHPRLKAGDLYVSDAASDNITHFKVNKTDCTLTLDTALYPSGDTGVLNGDGLAITPDGRTMFVGSTGDDHIYSHTIAANGSLGATFTEVVASTEPWDIEVSPDGKTLVVAYGEIQQVCAYPISGGHLDTANCQSTAGFPARVSIDPASACVYAGELRGQSEVAALTLTGGVLGTPTDYNPFGPGADSEGILVNYDNKAIYVSNPSSAQITTGSIASGCTLTYKAIISDGVAGLDRPSYIAQGKIAHGYVVNGDFANGDLDNMGIFHADANGKLTPVGSGQFPLARGGHGTVFASPETVVVVGVE
jgi:DNA-binding beta-propeller fold protein YncE